MAGAHGVLITNGTLVVTSAKGGSNATAFGLSQTGGTATLNGTDLTGTAPPAGSSGGTFKIAAGVKLQYLNTSSALTKYYDPTLLPAVGNVRSGTAYGGTDYTGTMPAGGIMINPGLAGGLR